MINYLVNKNKKKYFIFKRVYKTLVNIKCYAY